VETGGFRADLYYRLSVLSIDLPPLRQRPGDVPLLTAHFLKQFQGPDGAAHLTREAMEALAGHPYPGNVRELENALRRAMALSANGVITIDCLPPEIASAGGMKAEHTDAERSLVADRPGMDELQRRYLQLVLDETGWNRRRAAAVLKLDRRTIQRLIARYKLQGGRDPEDENGLDEGDALPVEAGLP
jgi:DNA-binding NtrC family response regulator